MKNKNFIRLISLALLICISVIALSSCTENKQSTENSSAADPFIPIDGEDKNGLVYHRESKTVYVLFKSDYGTNGYGSPGASYGYLAEYIINGHFCEYIDGKIVEVIPEVTAINTVNSNNEDVGLTADEVWETLTEQEKQALLAGK